MGPMTPVSVEKRREECYLGAAAGHGEDDARLGPGRKGGHAARVLRVRLHHLQGGAP
jgi:hypothetical protein